jgi:hypothetical protein
MRMECGTQWQEDNCIQGFGGEKLMETDQLGDLDIDRIILK